MRIPVKLIPLIEEGYIDEVTLQLMSGKEASVYVVHAQGMVQCAKVYKDAIHRNFKHNTDYTEGRKAKNSRHSRAMGKGSRFGRKEQESSWQNMEVTTLCNLGPEGVRVPKVYGYYDGVLLMELITDDEGSPAPRLHDVEFTHEEAVRYHADMMHNIVLMLCAGIIHGDLSEYNILMGAQGPVIIDFPQAINVVANNSAEKLLIRDVDNIKNFFGQFAPELLSTQYGKEMWELLKKGRLNPKTKLTGHARVVHKTVDVHNVLRVIDDAREEELEKKNKKED
jgi:RIO kinase 1